MTVCFLKGEKKHMLVNSRKVGEYKRIWESGNYNLKILYKNPLSVREKLYVYIYKCLSNESNITFIVFDKFLKVFFLSNYMESFNECNAKF